MNPYFTPQPDGVGIEIKTDTEADELRSYVGRKKHRRRTWCAIERKSGVILARHNGRRTDESCSLLMDRLSVFPVTRYYKDDWRSYRKYISPLKHIVGKADTWKTERKNLNFGTHIRRLNRKTICFSKNEKVHDNVIGMYINRYYFENGRYSESVWSTDLSHHL